MIRMVMQLSTLLQMFLCASTSNGRLYQTVAAVVLTAFCVHAVHDRVQLQLAHDEDHFHGAACVR